MTKLKEVEVKIYQQAAQMASDDDIAQILDLTPAQLERHRALIDRARAEAMVKLRYARAQATARQKAKA